MRLILIRHGETPSNVADLLDTGSPGPGLTAVGQEQAVALVDRLAAEPLDALYVSNLVRTHLTAAPLAAARGLRPVVREGLREINAGDYEMAGDQASILEYRRVVSAWAERDLTATFAGGERGTDVIARFDAVVAEARSVGSGAVAMVSHGAMIRCWATNRAVNLPAGFAASHLLPNTAVVVSDLVEGHWFVRSWTDTEVSARG